MQWYEQEVSELVAQLRHRAIPECPAVFYGSSSIRLWTGLAADLNDHRAVNVGFGGSTLEACVHFFDRLVPPLRPSSIVVYAGDNDLGDGRFPEYVAEMYDKLAHRIQQMQPAVPFGFISIKPSPVRKSILKRIRRANELIQNLSQKYPNAFFVDVFPTMLDSNGNPRAELFQEDGLHLNRKGYEVWASILEPYRHQIFITRCREILSLQLSSPLGESGIL